MRICKISDRKAGKTLPQLGYKHRYVEIYRAVDHEVRSIKPMDYVTLSRKFALGHAEHMAATEERDQAVLKAMVKADVVAEAYNPGEYFFVGDQEVVATKVDLVRFQTE